LAAIPDKVRPPATANRSSSACFTVAPGAVISV
jgi:hypothetical protein